MKKLLYILLLFTLFLSAQSYDASWKEVQEFEKKSLPKSALKCVKSIYTQAKNEKNENQFIKALLYKEKYLLRLNEEGYVKIIKDIEEAIKESPKKGTQLILYSILAQVYEYYLDRNRYRIYQRTKLKQNSSSDIKTWSIDKLSKKSSELYLKSLNKIAGNIQISEYKNILNKGIHIEKLQPTLYDFLAFRALRYFTNPRNTLNQTGQFTIKDPDAFASAYTFMYLSCSPAIKRQLKYNALVIYQELLKLHYKKHHKKALDYINVKRLEFVYNNFSNEKREQYYTRALKSLIYKNPKSEALLALANVYYREENYVKAIPYIEQVLKSSNNYIISRATELKNSIEAKYLKFQIEQVNLAHENILSKIEYKNANELFVKVIKLNHKEEAKLEYKNRWEYLDYLKTLPAIKNFKIILPKQNDYKIHSTEISLDHYGVGKYIVVLSLQKEIDRDAIYKIMNISNIAYMKQGNKRLLVVNRQTGEALKGVEVSFYEKSYNQQTRRYEKKFFSSKQSDNEGKIDIPKIKNNFEMTFKYKDDFLDLRENHYYDSYNREARNHTRTFVNFFTDRAIYRPNQSIYFKGLAIKQSSNKAPTILENKKIKVSFYNQNHQLIESKTFTSNEFGTFHGEFTAPKSGLLGSMSIQADIGGNKRIQVEEYKRPKFEVSFKQLEKSYKIGDKIELKGEAKAYAGNALDNVKVKYTIKRLVSFPWLPYWRQHTYNSYEETIDTGTIKSDKNGEFKIHFNALADKKFDSNDKPNYNYKISVDVTDTTGETHSATKNILLGYVGIQVTMNIDSELNIKNNSTLTIESTNLDGKFQAIQGEILIQKFTKEKRLYRKRYWQEAEKRLYSKEEFNKLFKHYRYSKKSNQAKELIRTIKFNTQKSKEVLLDNLEQGEYLLTLKSYDQYGVEVSTSKKLTIYDLKANTPPMTTYLWHKNDKKEYETPSIAKIYLKSSVKKLPVLLTIEKRGRVSQERWITIEKVKEELIKVAKEDRGDIHYQLNFIYNNRSFHIEDTLVVPWDSKLNIELISFRDTLKPNEKEQWKLKISGKNRERVMAEMVATMYDASLEEFLPHQLSIPYLFPIFRHNYISNWRSMNFKLLSEQHGWQKHQVEDFRREFPSLKWLNIANQHIYYDSYGSRNMMVMEEEAIPSPVVAPEAMLATPPRVKRAPMAESDMGAINNLVAMNSAPTNIKKPTTSPIHIRKNFNETMFFKPNLQTDKEGNIIINFKTNEALSRWNFIGFAHSKGLRTAIINKTLTTQKDLMVVSNLPRFFREKDTITLSAKIVNMSEKDLDGECELKLVDPLTEKAIYPNREFKKLFHVKKGSSAIVNFTITVPNIDKISAIKHTLIARTATHTDAEQVIKPILSNRVFITESKVLSVKANEEKTFTLKSMASNNSTTLQNHKLTLEFTSNPAWYAIQSLPYLMEYEHECSEQLFSRYYANALAQKIANKTPKIKAIFDEWRSKGKLKSKLSTNQELKSVLLEETPWVLEAQSQEQQQKNIALLFDLHKIASEQKEALEKLGKRQLSTGGWSWFGGNEASWYITQYILEGMGHLNVLGVTTNNSMIPPAINYIDQQIVQEYNNLLKSVENGYRKLEDDNLNSMIIHYLYTRSFFDKKMDSNTKQAHKYYLEQAKKFWTTKGIYEKGMIALALHRLGEKCSDIVASLKEHAIHNDELGTYFKYTNGYYWNELPIETHALMIELFETITDDKEMVENLKIWLLKQRQTSHWKTTKATSSAIYALLSNNNWLESNKLVELSFDTTKKYQPKLKEAQKRAIKGLGYYKVSYNQDEFDNSMATVKVKNPNKSIAWGGMYWQYFEDMDKVKTFKETPLTIDKKLFLIEETKQGKELIALTQQALKVGDKIKVRIEIRVDREMEYMMLKDNRASTFEPLNVISQYKYQDGLGYYQSTKDNATYFFIDYLRKGTYVFEYPLVVTHKGVFSNGITTMESMYAPEFKSHSEGITIEVH